MVYRVPLSFILVSTTFVRSGVDRNGCLPESRTFQSSRSLRSATPSNGQSSLAIVNDKLQ